ncbi:MAG: CcmD family protein [Chloroflexi bacterium]|nr:CcmD family protein [Chloroflexota bacterium]
MSDLSYLFVGYTVIWGALFLYLFRLQREGERLRRELEAAKQARKEKQG